VLLFALFGHLLLLILDLAHGLGQGCDLFAEIGNVGIRLLDVGRELINLEIERTDLTLKLAKLRVVLLDAAHLLSLCTLAELGERRETNLLLLRLLLALRRHVLQHLDEADAMSAQRASESLNYTVQRLAHTQRPSGR
jgi:hypothetical protein